MISKIHTLPDMGLANGDLPDFKSGQFQSSLIDDLTPVEEIQFCIEVEEALCEKDIIALRNKLKNINKKTGVPITDDALVDTNAYFGLSEELSDPIKLNLEGEGHDFGNYLQQLHIKNYNVSSNERIHDLNAEASEMTEPDIQMMSPEDEMLFEAVREAVSEKEILDLRANLQSILQSISVHERTFEEIEDFLSGELDEEIDTQIREELRTNSALSFEINLHGEIDAAVGELDIIKLRASLGAIIQNEYSHSHSVAEIDNYLNEELDEQALALFEDELISNPGLAADLAFHREVDRAIAETDIIAMRANLQDISRNQRNQTDEKLGVTAPKRKHLFWYAAASVILLMFVITSLVKSRVYSSQQLYTAYYQPYKNAEGVSRSGLISYNRLDKALHEIDKGNYQTALSYLGNIPESERDGYSVNFYSGVAYQELGEYKNAIGSFSEVVKHGDNLLVEQSEWYIGLCYLRTDEREKALAQFKTILSRKGYYGEQSRKLLKQME